MTKVVQLNKTQNDRLIEDLKEMLKEAEEGRLVGMVAIKDVSDLGIDFYIEFDWELELLMIGALEQMKAIILGAADE